MRKFIVPPPPGMAPEIAAIIESLAKLAVEQDYRAACEAARRKAHSGVDGSSILTKEQIVSSASNAMYGKPLVTNVFRSMLVEAMVASVLPDWEWCSGDYASCDFRHGNIRLEVKQSALRQTWSRERLSRVSWDIAARTGHYSDGGAVWSATPGRNADIYVFALHSVVDESADHREPEQWSFYVVPTSSLPAKKTVGLNAVGKLAAPVQLSRLAPEMRRLVEIHANCG